MADHESPTNIDHANWARAGVQEMARITGVESDNLRTQICDFVANLMHLCNQEEIDFELVLMHARDHYTIEIEEEKADESEIEL